MTTISPSAPMSTVARPEVSLWQLYVLRAAYLLIFAGLAVTVWPTWVHHSQWILWQGVGKSVLTAISLLAALGLRYPLKMLPLLFFELAWKSIWLLGIALPLWLNHSRIDADTADTIQACLMGAIVLVIIPWRYVFATFLREPADRWK